MGAHYKAFFCPQCGKEYVAGAAWKRPACPDCLFAESKKERENRAVCPVCRKPFQRKKITQIYCSAACRIKNKQALMRKARLERRHAAR